jgi:hypothetical protein
VALTHADDASFGPAQLGADLQQLLHQLTNQLSVIVAHAEILEFKALDSASQSRATQAIAGALGAMTTVRAIMDSLDAHTD